MRGIYTQRTFPDAQYLRAGCDCGNTDHDHDIAVEVDGDIGTVIVSLSSNLEHCAYQVEWHGNIFQKVYARISAAMKIIFTGRLQISSSFYFSNEQHAKDYTSAILRAIEEVKHNDQ